MLVDCNYEHQKEITSVQSSYRGCCECWGTACACTDCVGLRMRLMSWKSLMAFAEPHCLLTEVSCAQPFGHACENQLEMHHADWSLLLVVEVWIQHLEGMQTKKAPRGDEEQLMTSADLVTPCVETQKSCAEVTTSHFLFHTVHVSCYSIRN